MEIYQIIQSYWWAGILYFLVGFVAYHIEDWRSGPLNSFWGGLFVATMWGLFWLPLLILIPPAMFMVLIEKKITKRLGWHIRIFYVLCSLFWLYTTTNGFLRGEFRFSLGTLIWLVLGWAIIKNSVSKAVPQNG